MAGWISRGLPSAGIYAGPMAWLVSTQVNYALVPWVCAYQVPVIPITALILALLTLFGGYLSWRAYTTAMPAHQPDSARGGRPQQFVALMGIAIALLFATVILIHGAAGLVFHGCER